MMSRTRCVFGCGRVDIPRWCISSKIVVVWMLLVIVPIRTMIMMMATILWMRMISSPI